jgi:hypothetical protein
MSVESTHVDEVAGSSQASAPPRADNQPPVVEPQPQLEQGEASSPSNAPEHPGQRMKIGSEREGITSEAKAKPVTPGTPSSATKPAAPKREPKHYPPPNVRDQLSPELEAEYAAALGELSLENLMSEEVGGGPPPELAPESRVTGKVAKIHREDVFVDLASRNQGIVPLRQFEEPPVVGA